MKGFRIIHAIADCSDCDFVCEDRYNASRKAREHAKKTGHQVFVEIGHMKIYNERSENTAFSTKGEVL